MSPEAERRLTRLAVRIFGIKVTDLRTLVESDPGDAKLFWGEKLRELKPRYLELALELHPDRGGDHEKFTEVQAAWDLISDPSQFLTALCRVKAVAEAELRRRRVAVAYTYPFAPTYATMTYDSTSSTTTTVSTGSGVGFSFHIRFGR